MPRQFTVLSNTEGDDKRTYKRIMPEEKLCHFKNVTAGVLQEAQDVWAEIWKELDGSVTHGTLVTPEVVEGGFKPECGWPEFLERMWLLKHYIDYAQRYCKENI